MITGDYSRYQLNAEQFYSLFEEMPDNKLVDKLGQSAANGNLDCIDMLHNLALRGDNTGKRAEDILFNLFSGKAEGKKGVDKEIQSASLQLYEAASHASEKNNADMSKFYCPSKLLYMAGSAVSSKTQRQDLSSLFRDGATAQSPFEQIEDVDLWSNDRMLMTDEINAALKNTIPNNSNLSLNFPFGLTNPINNANFLAEQIIEKRASMRADFLSKAEVFPINTGNHWILFQLYTDTLTDAVKCVVFNSYNELSPAIKNMLFSSAKIAGLHDAKNMTFIEGNIQKNVPNGCGVFVIKAIDYLSHASEKNPADALIEFKAKYSVLPEEEQMLFNIQTRRQLYEHSIL